MSDNTGPTRYSALSLRLKDDQRAILEALRDHWGLSMAATILRACTEALERETKGKK